jgi:polyisoprenoid-binding protein YceI
MTRFLFLALALAPGLGFADSQTWKIDPNHSDAQFAVRHLVVSTVRGHFGKTAGAVMMDDKDLGRSSVEATVDVSTIDTRVPDRDAHLKSPDFFDSAKYPTKTFRSTKVEKAAKGNLEVTGDLTIKGNTRPTVFQVTYSQPIKGAKGEDRRGFSATARINRKDFGLNWSKMVEAGPVVGDEVQITIDAEAIRDQAKATAATEMEKK